MSPAHGLFFFAQTEYSAPDGYTHFIECAFYTMGFVAMAVLAFRAIFPTKEKEKKPVPQPLFVAAQPIYADKAETDQRFKHIELKIEASRIENRDEMQKLRDEAVEGRRGLHKDIERNADRVADKFDKFAIEITNSVGELRGQIREMGK